MSVPVSQFIPPPHFSPIKLLDENIGRTLSDIKHSNIVFDPPPRVMKIKTKIDRKSVV